MAHILFFKKFFLKILLNITIQVILVNGKFFCLAKNCLLKYILCYFIGYGQDIDEIQPEFLAPLDNLTITQGRDISFTCVVNNLGQYRVSYGFFIINYIKKGLSLRVLLTQNYKF